MIGQLSKFLHYNELLFKQFCRKQLLSLSFINEMKLIKNCMSHVIVA